ncbi:hypothetical protein NC651_010948 [Populus alba x Populus x berolinensis]|nr:hypothetical protein NC651_010948 [Populus alba x Populus x berolinensis]
MAAIPLFPDYKSTVTTYQHKARYHSTAAGSAHWGFWRWNSPVAYVFVGVAFILGLITVSLIILACSSAKSLSNSSTSEAEDEKSAKQVEIEPSIVVIMAGDHNPTYLAKPVSCNCPSLRKQSNVNSTGRGKSTKASLQHFLR